MILPAAASHRSFLLPVREPSTRQQTPESRKEMSAANAVETMRASVALSRAAAGFALHVVQQREYAESEQEYGDPEC
jgi:hypothetical protein